MASVVSAIEECGVEVDFVPGGCTGLCQPVDVGINKPFKNSVRNYWEDWMLSEGIQQAITRPPSRAMIAHWSVSALKGLPKQLVKNAWRHGDYSYFPNEPSVRYSLDSAMNSPDILEEAEEVLAQSTTTL